MKLHIAYPTTGCQKVVEIDDERKLRAFYDKRISHEVEGHHVSDEFKGYVFKITGGNDKQGFPMKQGVLTSQRVRLLMSEGHSCYRTRKRGERKRKSVRGCIVSGDLSVLNLVVVKKGDAEVPGLTDTTKPRRLGPKRASKIRKLFNLTKDDDVRKFVIRRPIQPKGENKKTKFKAPNIQRLITPQRLQRKRAEKAEGKRRYIKAKQEATDFNALVIKRLKEAKDKRAKVVAAKRSQSARQASQGAPEVAKPVAATPAAAPATAAAPAKAGAEKKQKEKKEKKPHAAAPPAHAPAKAAPAAAKAEKPAGKKSEGKKSKQ